MFDYGDKTLTFEVRGLPTGGFKNTAARVGVIFEERRRPVDGDSELRLGDRLRQGHATRCRRFTGTGDDDHPFRQLSGCGPFAQGRRS